MGGKKRRGGDAERDSRRQETRRGGYEEGCTLAGGRERKGVWKRELEYTNKRKAREAKNKTKRQGTVLKKTEWRGTQQKGVQRTGVSWRTGKYLPEVKRTPVYEGWL